ncbi:MAG TPA: hypothetical protein VFT82_00350 [Candidatus Paceibacterota bacterium]|nr:hypothetical protein [Candidatus Paceibacterota bacterium]
MDNSEAGATSKLLPAGTIIRNAWAFYKKNLKKLWPLFILGSLSTASFRMNSASGDHFFKGLPTSALVGIIVLSVVIGVFLFLSKVALFKSLSDTYRERFVGLKDAYKKSFHLFWPFLFLSIISPLAVYGGFVLLIIPGIAIGGYLTFSLIVLVDTDRRGFDALVGSIELVRGRWWEVFWKLLLIGIYIALIALVIGIVAVIAIAIASFVLHFSIPTTIAVGTALASALVFVIFVPFGFITLFEIYRDLVQIQAPEAADAEAKRQKRRKTMIAFAVLGLVAFIPTAYFGIKYAKEQAVAQRTVTYVSQPYQPSVGSFTLDFGGTPTMQTLVAAAPDGTTYPVYLFDKSLGGGVTLIAEYVNFPQSSGSISANPKQTLDESMNSTLTDSGAALVSSQALTYKGLPANDFTASLDKLGAVMTARTVIDGQDYYFLSVSYPKDADASTTASIISKFFDSLTFNK